MNEIEQIDGLLGIKLSSVTLAMKAKIAAALEASGHPVSFDDWLGLLPILRKPGLSQKELAFLLGKDKTTVSRQVDGFEKRKLVARRPSKEDGRAFELHLTETGMKYHRQALPAIAELDREFAEGLTEKDLQELEKILNKIKRNLNPERS